MTLKGPWADKGRKFMMLLPFVGHLISVAFYIVFLYFENWPGIYLMIIFLPK